MNQPSIAQILAENVRLRALLKWLHDYTTLQSNPSVGEVVEMRDKIYLELGHEPPTVVEEGGTGGSSVESSPLLSPRKDRGGRGEETGTSP